MTFFSHRQLFSKSTPFIQNLLPFLCIFLSSSLFLLSFMFFNKKNQKLLSDYCGGKRSFAPILIIGGACPLIGYTLYTSSGRMESSDSSQLQQSPRAISYDPRAYRNLLII